MKVLNIVGARPNFMKIAPLHRAFEAHGGFDSRIVHTGQHYDERMSDIFFRQLDLPQPHVYLGLGGGSHAEQTARIMLAFERVLDEEQPDLVLVVGDVNSTLACALVACKRHVPVAHVEAGLRSGDRTMPEEINRIVTDSVADFLFVTEESGLINLGREGVDPAKIFFVGNVMIDALLHFREKAAQSTILDDLALSPGAYVLMTMHRPATVDRRKGLETLLDLIKQVATRRRVVFPLHPRTRQRLVDFALLDKLTAIDQVDLLEPQGYLPFLHLMAHAHAVITDSGGIQEETTFLGVPCLTLRSSTERPATVTHGTNTLLPLDADVVAAHVHNLVPAQSLQPPPLWDGQSALRIVHILTKRMQEHRGEEVKER